MVAAGSPVALLVDGAFGMAQQLLAVNSKVLLIGRAYEPFDPVHDWFSAKPEDAAQRWFDGQWPRIAAHPLIKTWAGPNEPGVDDAAHAAWYARFEIKRMQLMEAQGLRCVIANFGCGRPPLLSENGTWQAFLPALRYAEAHRHYLGLHEYSWPKMSQAQTWLCLRYRRVYEALGLTVPLIITECGIDPSIGENLKPFRGGGAFRDAELRSIWQAHYGAANADIFYSEELRWYDRELQKDAYVKGAVIYTVGDDGHWGSYDLGGQPVISMLCTHIQSEAAMPIQSLPSASKPLYTGKVDAIGANVRDGQGAVVGKLAPGAMVWVYEVRTIAGWQDRAVINPTTRLNIWAERIVRDVPPPVVKQGEFDSPVGTAAERAGEELWPGQWIDANSYGNRYTDSAGNAALHPGADLNLNSPTWDSDKGAPVYACADGTVRYAALRGFAWSNIVIVEHVFVASRYAHLATMAVIAGQAVKRGDLLGTIGHPGGGPTAVPDGEPALPATCAPFQCAEYPRSAGARAQCSTGRIV